MVEEILRHILSFVVDHPGGQNSTLCAAVRVNSLWSFISLDIIWSDISCKIGIFTLGLAADL